MIVGALWEAMSQGTEVSETKAYKGKKTVRIRRARVQAMKVKERTSAIDNRASKE
jgi:hypothetical protein